MYDTVEWVALEASLKELGIPSRFIRWVMLTVSTVSYKFLINGETTQYLQAKRWLRQGNPLSPLLFVIVMEYLHRPLQKLSHIPDFTFHSKCERLHIVNLSFADDLLLFARGDTQSVALVMSIF